MVAEVVTLNRDKLISPGIAKGDRMKANYKTDLICISGSSTLRDAREMMRENRIRHLPVINSQKEIVGILSKHDMSDLPEVQDYPVEMLAHSPVMTVSNEMPLRAAALKMVEEKISSVLVTDAHQNVLGIITTDDLLYELARRLEDKPQSKDRSWTESDSLITVGEFFRRLSDIGI